IPLLWVLPLGLYLLSFILVFSRLPGWVHGLMVTLLPFLVLPLVFLMLSELPLRITGKIGIHLAVLFVVALVFHGDLARDRLAAAVVGGLVLVALRRPKDPALRAVRWFDFALPVSLGVLAVGLNVGLRISTIFRGIQHLFLEVLGRLPAEWAGGILTILDGQT